mgnify:CR=1 FL=1|tara:strand:- start:2221 stop:3390 length:1170 start_codon:yes stop_codon:yes gene_type:complete
MPIYQRCLLIILIALSTSCTGKKIGKIENITSNVVKIEKEYFLDKITESEVFDSVSFIPLYLPENELMGSVSDIQLYRNNYYVLDLITQKIHQFNKDWVFKKTLFSLGAGPNEYNEIFNFSFYENSIVINDLLKVEYYDLDDFQPIKTYRKNHMGFRTYLTQDEHILNYQLNSPFDDSPFNVSIYNYTNDDITYQGSPIKPNLQGFTFSQKNPFYTNMGNDYFIEAFNDTIYKVDNGILLSHRFIDFQDIRLEIKDLIDEPGITSTDVMRSDKAYFLGSYLNSDAVETFSFTYKTKRYIYMANKKDSVYHIYSSMVQDKTVLQLPIDYFLLDGENLFSAKDIEQANYELGVVKERVASRPDLEVHRSKMETLSEKLSNASAVIIKIHIK